MASRRAVKAAPDLDDATMPAWQRRSVDRSLQFAHARAQARSNRFVTAAIKLLEERGDIDFTVQDVVERSRMSIRTFYKYFEGKEDLLVALYETVIARDTVPRLRKRIDKQRDPLLRLRAYIGCLIDFTTQTKPAVRTLTTYGNRLAASRPADLARAMKPQFDLLLQLIKDISRTKRLRRDLTVEAATRLTQHTVLAAVHGRVLGSEDDDISAQTIWQFCVGGLGLDVPSSASAAR
jgi:AcrR family transcriptional regulator